MDARNTGDAARACGLYSHAYQDKLARYYSSCEAHFRSKPPEPLSVSGAAVQHPPSRVIVTITGQRSYISELELIDGQWRLISAGP